MRRFHFAKRMLEAVAVAAVVLFWGVTRTTGAILYEDVFYWLPDGSSQIDPSSPPTNALVKLQETVYDDAQGRQVINSNLGFGLIHGGPLPTGPINVYGYSITNLRYGNGPTSGSGAGITGFNIPDLFGGSSVQWGPNGSASWWQVAPGHSGPGNFEWDVDGNNNGSDGDGVGIPLGNTFNGFYIAVPDGTPHGIVSGASLHTWTGGGLLEEPAAVQTDLVFGMISAPVPEPSTNVLISLGVLGLIGLTWRRH